MQYNIILKLREGLIYLYSPKAYRIIGNIRKKVDWGIETVSWEYLVVNRIIFIHLK